MKTAQELDSLDSAIFQALRAQALADRAAHQRSISQLDQLIETYDRALERLRKH